MSSSRYTSCYLYLSRLKSEVLGQSKQTGPYVSYSPGKFAHVLPALHAGIVPVDESRLTVILLAVSSQYVDLLLQDSGCCAHMGHGQRCHRSPGIRSQIVDLAGFLVGVKLPQVAHTTSNVKPASQGLHAMQGSVSSHVCQVGGSFLWVVQQHGRQALILTVETTGDEDASICGSDSMAAQSLVEGMDEAERRETSQECNGDAKLRSSTDSVFPAGP